MGELIYTGIVIAIVIGINESVKTGCRNYLNKTRRKRVRTA